MKKDRWMGKVSILDHGGRHYITLEMPRDPDEAQMHFIMDWLLRPWIGKNVIMVYTVVQFIVFLLKAIIFL